MSADSKNPKIEAAEAAIYSLEVAQDNIKHYLKLHGLAQTDVGVSGRAAEFNMGGVELRAEFDATVTESLERTIKTLELFLGRNPK